MSDAKSCPKCSGPMIPGRILKYNEYVAGNKYMYVFAPDADVTPDLSKALSGKRSDSRKPLVAYCCEQCGFVEFYGRSIG